jgi:hypothetical protein
VSGICSPRTAGSLLGLDLCYASRSLAKAKDPRDGASLSHGGAVMELETWNYFYLESVTRFQVMNGMGGCFIHSPDEITKAMDLSRFRKSKVLSALYMTIRARC